MSSDIMNNIIFENEIRIKEFLGEEKELQVVKELNGQLLCKWIIPESNWPKYFFITKDEFNKLR